MVGKLLVVTGFPAAGKDSVIGEFLKRNPDYHTIVTHTSRPQRSGEIQGVHYHFVTTSEFKELVAEKHLLEHVKTGLYYKGTSLTEFNKVLKGTNSIWKIELTRFINYEETILNSFDENSAKIIINRSVKILLKPESKKIALERYQNRDGKSSLEDFHIRWNFETSHFRKNREKIPHIVTNRNGNILSAVQKIENIIASYPRSDFRINTD